MRSARAAAAAVRPAIPPPGPDVHAIGVPAMTLSAGRDGELRVRALNAAHARMSGLVEARVRGLRLADCLDAAAAARLAEAGRRCLLTIAAVEVEEALERPGGLLWWRTTLVPVGEGKGAAGAILALGIDVTAGKLRERELVDAALLDPLTGIGNRRRFDAGLREAIGRAEASGRPFALLLGDVDRFKAVNDGHGHGVGDEVLRRVAAEIRGTLRAGDLVARLGGDEFAAIVEAETRQAVEAACGRLRGRLGAGIEVAGLAFRVGVSLGAAAWLPGASALDLLRIADLDMYADKARRRLASSAA